MELIHITGPIYCLKIPLPDNPLKCLNSYIIKGGAGERSLMIDCGFYNTQTHELIADSLEALSLSYSELDVFLSHYHSDHTGNAHYLQKKGCKILISERAYRLLEDSELPLRRRIWMRSEGVPETLIEAVLGNTHFDKNATRHFEPMLVDEGDTLNYGAYHLRCIRTPGHSPGHLCLYDEARGAMFTGDHVLYDVVPGITPLTPDDSSLTAYMSSLNKLKPLYTSMILPSHGMCCETALIRRINEIERHHLQRVDCVRDFIFKHPEHTAFEIARDIRLLRNKKWEELHYMQQWYVIMEALGDILYLRDRGDLDIVCKNGFMIYRPSRIAGT